MARTARLVVPGIPHHVTQRGVRRMETFVEAGDYEVYQGLLTEWCGKAGTDIWTLCLMPNHVHLIVVPSHEDGLRAALGEARRRYTRHNQLPARLARASLAGALSFLPDGRGLSFDLRPICGAQHVRSKAHAAPGELGVVVGAGASLRGATTAS